MRLFLVGMFALVASLSIVVATPQSASAITCLETDAEGKQSTRIIVDGTVDDCEGEVILAVNGELCDGKPFLDRSILGIPYWYKYLNGQKDLIIYEGSGTDPGTQGASGCTPTLRNSDGDLDPNAFLGIGLAVLEGAMVLAGVVAVIMVIWGSYQYVLTQGESDKAASARKTVINAAIGLVIVIVATRVVSFIATRLTS